MVNPFPRELVNQYREYMKNLLARGEGQGLVGGSLDNKAPLNEISNSGCRVRCRSVFNRGHLLESSQWARASLHNYRSLKA